VNSLEKVNYSKIPVYSTLKTNIVGFIKVKNLLSFDISKKTKLKDGNVITQILKIN
jgi:CBS domain containing-hemolysin-like protein